MLPLPAATAALTAYPLLPSRDNPAILTRRGHLHCCPAMLACVRTAAVFGIEACPVQVEVDVSFGLPTFAMVGLPDAGVRESRDRIRSAIRNSGFEFPPHRITVNLAPADVRKAGATFDLPIALGVLAAAGRVDAARRRRRAADWRAVARRRRSSRRAACCRSPRRRAANGYRGLLLPAAQRRRSGGRRGPAAVWR